MKDMEIYGKLISIFVKKMTSPEIGQFRLEISTFRIILERTRVKRPVLIKFTLTESGKIVNNLDDNEESLDALKMLLKRSMDFISSLIGEELAKDIIVNSLKDPFKEISDEVKNNDRFMSFVPEPFNHVLKENFLRSKGSNDHDAILETFEDIFQSYLKDLSKHTDLSAFKLKLSILREEYELLKHIEVKNNSTVEFDLDYWSKASDIEVSSALVAAFNSLVGLSTFLLGKEEAVKKATRTFQYYFEGRDELLNRYNQLVNRLLDGALYLKVTTGIEELDQRMGGGITKGDSILFISPSGIERDIFTTQMLTLGLKGGSSVLMVLSKEPPRSIRMLLRSQGMNADALEDEGSLRIVDWFSWRGERIIGVEKEGHSLKSSKILSNLGIAINKGLRELSFSTNKIGLVHIIGPATNIFDYNQVYNFVQRLRAKFKDEEMASIFILESETMSPEMKSRTMEIFDGAIELKKTTKKGSIERELSVVSMSNVDFDPKPIPFIIRNNRIIPRSEVEKEENEKFEKIIDQKHEKDNVEEMIEVADEDDVILLKNVKKEKIPKKTEKRVPLKRKIVRRKAKIQIPNKKKEPTPELPAKTRSPEDTQRTSPKPCVKRKITRNVKKLPSPKKKMDGRKVAKNISRSRIGPKDKGSKEDILLEAIATIDELLDGSEETLKEKTVRKRIVRRIK